MRPSKYKPEYCEEAYEILALGKTKNAVCTAFKICRDTLGNWQKEWPDFESAIKIGLAASEAHWEEIGRAGMYNKDFNDKMFRMRMLNCFGWRTIEIRELSKMGETELRAQASVVAMALELINKSSTEVSQLREDDK
jgi:hypothetical protein